MLAGAAAWSPTDGLAQSDWDLAAIIGLFEGGCLRFAGNPAGLRGWAAARGLQPVPEGQAEPFLGGFGTGLVFAASTASGRHALVSYDNGACQVAAPAANPVALLFRLRSRLNEQGVAVSPPSGGLRSTFGAMQVSFHAWSGRRRWLIGILSAPRRRPGWGRELHLFGMLDPLRAPGSSRSGP